MKPTYVEFDALRNELSVMRLQLALARDAMAAFTDPEGNMPANTGEFNDLKKALAAIDDSKVLDGLVICDAEPVAWKFSAPGITKLDVCPHGGKWVPLYARRKP